MATEAFVEPIFSREVSYDTEQTDAQTDLNLYLSEIPEDRLIAESGHFGWCTRGLTPQPTIFHSCLDFASGFARRIPRVKKKKKKRQLVSCVTESFVRGTGQPMFIL